jgi:ABC-type Fe3+-hydroxamate transport system substrate-binding protein
MNKILIYTILMLISFSSFSQSSNKNVALENVIVVGTYQIQVINSRDEPFIPSNIEEIVISNRKKEDVFYYKLSDLVRIKILPTDSINSADFKPLQLIEHIQE